MLCLLGPPLEGTSCGGEGTHWCREGACVPVQVTGHSKDDITSPPVSPVQAARWSGWEAGDCSSGCLEDSVGARTSTRHCLVLRG